MLSHTNTKCNIWPSVNNLMQQFVRKCSYLSKTVFFLVVCSKKRRQHVHTQQIGRFYYNLSEAKINYYCIKKEESDVGPSNEDVFISYSFSTDVYTHSATLVRVCACAIVREHTNTHSSQIHIEMYTIR